MEQVEGNINPTRELAAIMFSDVVGYTAIMGRDEQKGVQAIADHRAQLRSLLPRFNGRLIGEIGDGTLTSFHSVLDAIGCARELQANLKDDRELRLRIGIHLGDVLLTNNTVLGDGVNVASRIHALAPPGGICVSEHVYDEIRNKPGMVARNLGKKNLKNVSRPIRVYALQVVGEDLSAGSKFGKRVAFGALISALMGAIAAAYLYRAQIQTALSRSGPTIAGGKVTLAVLPFANLSASKDDEYFSDGITDEIRGDLSKIAGLQVIARTSSFAFKGQNEDVKKIASLLNVRNVLEGSVRKSADRVRIEVELIDASNGFTIWSDRYDEKMADVFQIQSDVAESVAQKLVVKLLRDVRARLDQRPTENLEAYDLYLRGLYYNSQFSEDGWTKAIDYLRRATEKDPNFGLAYVELANAYAGTNSFTMRSSNAFHEMKAAIERALAIDETLAGAHGALAYALYGYEWNWPGAEREFKRALELEPSNALVRADYGEFLDRMGRYDEALLQAERALELNPLDVQTLLTVGWVYRDSGNEERAVWYFNEVIEMAPDNPFGYFQRGMVHAMQHDFLAAVPDLEKGAALGHMPVVEAWLASTYALAGRPSDARKILSQLKEQSSQRFVDPTLFSGIYFALGDKDQGFQSMERAYEGRSYFMAGLKSPMWDTIPNIRQDPRFQAIYKKVGLPE